MRSLLHPASLSPNLQEKFERNLELHYEFQILKPLIRIRKLTKAQRVSIIQESYFHPIKLKLSNKNKIKTKVSPDLYIRVPLSLN